MQLVKIISTRIDNLKRRLIKVQRFGSSDIREPFEANNFGIDSNPIPGMVAVYSNTEENGKSIIVGYLNKNQLSQSGETRLFSLDADGNLKTYIWLTNTGIIKLGGNSDNAVKYIPLNQALSDFKIQMQAELVKIAAGIATGGGSYSPATLNIDISGSKIDNIKTS